MVIMTWAATCGPVFFRIFEIPKSMITVIDRLVDNVSTFVFMLRLR